MFGDDGAWIDALANALMREPRVDALSRVPVGVREAVAEAFLRGPEDDALSIVYEAHLSQEARRRGGIHYTPAALATHVVREAIALTRREPERTESTKWTESVEVYGVPLARSEPRTVLDPAMGTGVFLRAAVRLLATGATPTHRLTIAEHVFGFDLDPRAVQVARLALWLLVGDPSIDKGRFDRNLVHADAMLTPARDGFVRSAWSELLPRAPARFDLVLMNPPFLGGKRLRTVLGEPYAAALVRALPETNGNTDLSAHFLRRGFEALAPEGVLGAITTNSIAQGDTREAGLAYLTRSGAHIVRAETRVPWPGVAGVVTSLLWLSHDAPRSAVHLDGRDVPSIDAFLSPYRRSADAPRQPAMRGRAFIGCFLRGRGFVFDDEPDGRLNEELARALSLRPESARRVVAFLGGEEIMTGPNHRARRHVIDFAGAGRALAERDVELFALVRERVKPFRDARDATAADRAHRASFWRFANHRPTLRRATAGLSHVLVIPRVASQVAAIRMENRFVFSDQLVVVASGSHAVLALLNSRIHCAWATLFCSTLGDGLRYTPSDVFETFPIPCDSFEALERHEGLGRAGETFEEARTRSMHDEKLSLSALMRRLARERGGRLEPLRERLIDLDRAALDAYGFRDLDPGHWHEDRGRPAFDAELRREVLTRLFDRSMAPAR